MANQKQFKPLISSSRQTYDIKDFTDRHHKDKTEGAGDTEAETYGPLERKKHIKKETARET